MTLPSCQAALMNSRRFAGPNPERFGVQERRCCETNESRLSDISLEWMAELVSKKLPKDTRVLIQSDLLQCFPSSDGMMHDELMAGAGSHHLHLLARGDRRVDPGGTLHHTVIARLKMKSVRNFVGFGKYRPTSLQEHPQAKSYYNNHQSRGDDTHQSELRIQLKRSMGAIADLHSHRISRSQAGCAPLPAHVFPDVSRYLTAILRPFRALRPSRVL